MKRMLTILSTVLLATSFAWATSGPREARGEVIDKDGNPVAGAVVTFTPMESANTDPVSAKTNKKGRFFAPNLFSTQGDRFKVEVSMEGMLPTYVRLESRSVNRVLVGDPQEKNLKYGQSLPNIFIRPLGEGIVNLTLAPEADVMAAAQAEAQAVAAAEGGEGGEAAAPTKDPWDEALALASDGDLADAVPLFEEAIEDQPEEFERRETFAKVLYQIERHDEAIVQAQKAIEIDPKAISPRMVIYTSYVAQEKLDEAQAMLAEAREISPQNINVLEQMAYVANQRDDLKAAIAAYEEIVSIDGERASAWRQLGDLYAKNGQGDKSEAAFEKVSELGGDGGHQAYFNIGALLANKSSRTPEETQKAIDAFRKAIEIKPDYGEAHKQLAFMLLGAGDSAGAKNALLKYVEVAPNAPDAAQMKSLADAM